MQGIDSALVRAVADIRHDQCRFPIGDLNDVDFRFCSDPVEGFCVYCACHRKIAVDKTVRVDFKILRHVRGDA